MNRRSAESQSVAAETPVPVFSFFHEYPPQPHEKMLAELRDALGGGAYYHGFLRRYEPGFFRGPRLLNFVYIYFLAPWWVWRSRRTTLVTVTTPPAIQVWLAVWCYLFGVPLVVWLMDYHPELEARVLEKHGWGRWAATGLRRLDAWALRHTRLVVALDEAIAAVVRRREPGVPILIHSTWTSQADSSPATPGDSAVSIDKLVILHAGNLGQSHDLTALQALLAGCLARGRVIELVVTGGSPEGNARFRQMAESLGVAVDIHPRLPYGELVSVISERQVGLGLVLMKDGAAGLVSPSKFYTYLQLGLPLLYIGPEGTNADTACRRYTAGMSLPNSLNGAGIEAFERQYFSAESRGAWSAGVKAAAEYFGRHNASTLAAAIRQFLVGPVSDAGESEVAASSWVGSPSPRVLR